MRLVTFLSIFAPACMWAAADPALMNVKTVYVMPMGKGLDQYLANHLTQNRVFEVVTDPALADAVLSDRIGPAFEQALAELYPPPPPPEPPVEKEAEKTDTKPAAAEATSIGAASPSGPMYRLRGSSFSRGRGNVFIVDRKTKRVLWSDFHSPRNSQPQEIDYTADKFVDRLAKDLDRLRQPPK